MINTISPGMTGGMTGPQGEWIDRRTGNKVIVRDTIYDGTHQSVHLSDGRVLTMNEFGNNFIQMSNEEYDANGRQIGVTSIKETSKTKAQKSKTLNPNILFKGMDKTNKQDVDFTEIPEENIESFVDDDLKLSYNNAPQESNVMSSHESMVKKILDKVEDPKLNVSIDWGNSFPKNEFNMLSNFFDITNDDIVDAIVKKYVNIENIKESLKQQLLENYFV